MSLESRLQPEMLSHRGDTEPVPGTHPWSPGEERRNRTGPGPGAGQGM